MTQGDRDSSSLQRRLEQVIAAYLRAAELGMPVDREELLARHPDLAEHLRAFFAAQDQERDAAPANAGPQASTLPPTVTPGEMAREAEKLPPGNEAETLPQQDSLPPTTPGVHPASRAPNSALGHVRYFGDYELLAEIARGGMGVVYKARQVSLNRIVALKMILAGQLAGEDDVRRFYTEAEAAANLDHPGIVPIFEVGQHEGQHYFSMGFVEGQSLAQKLAAGPLPPREAAELVLKVTQAIAYAHERGVIHRDLKPGNILLDVNGQPRVTDFGLAKRTTAAEHSSVGALTATGQVLGTPSYMPPEQAAGKIEEIGPLADVYALGAVLYAVLTGRPPFQSANVVDTLLAVLEQEPVPPRQLSAGVPTDLETICLKCLEKASRRRYAGAQALVDELGRYLRGEPIHARPIRHVERLWRWCRRNPALAITGGVAAAAVIAVTALSIGFALSQREAATRLAAANQSISGEQLRTQAALGESKLKSAQLNETNARLESTIAQMVETEKRRRAAMLASASMVLDKGCSFCQSGQPGLGLLFLAQSLEIAPSDDADLQHAIRANFAAWSRRAGRLRAILSHPGDVDVVAFSPDGKTCLSGGMGGAQIWDVATGTRTRIRLRRENGVGVAAFGPDGKTILVGSAASYNQTGGPHLWDATTGKSLGPPPLHTAAVLALAFSPDGSVFATGSWDHTARLWETATRRALGPPLEHEGHVVAVAFSPDGKTLATGSEDKTARLWEVPTGKPLGEPMRLSDKVRQVTFTPDGKTVITLSQTEASFLSPKTDELRFWNADTGKSVGKPFVCEPRDKVVALSPDRKTVLTVRDDLNDESVAQLWDLPTRKRVRLSLGYSLPYGIGTMATFSPDGVSVLTFGSHFAQLWDVRTGAALGDPLRHLKRVNAAAFSADGKIIITAADKDHEDATTEVRLWTADTEPPGGPLLRHKAEIVALTFSSDSKRIVTGSFDMTAQVWDVATGRPLTPPLQHKHRVSAVAISPDGNTAATASLDDSARLWDVGSGKPIGAPLQHQRSVLVVAFSPDGKSVLTGSSDRTARLWDTRTGKSLGTAMKHEEAVWAAAFSADGNSIVTLSSDGIAKCWNGASGAFTGIVLKNAYAASWGPAPRVIFGPDGKTVLIASGSEARLWDAITGAPRTAPLKCGARVTYATFGSDGKTVFTVANNLENSLRREVASKEGDPTVDAFAIPDYGTAQLWDVRTGNPIKPELPGDGRIFYGAWSSDRNMIAVAGNSGEIHLCQAMTGALIGEPLLNRTTVRGMAFSPDSRILVTIGSDNTARLWNVPTPTSGDPMELVLKAQVGTGLELDKSGTVKVLDAKSWEDRRRLLATVDRQSKLREAVASGRKTLELDPKDVQAYYKIGNALYGLGKLDEAIASYRRVLELDPNNANAHHHLGIALDNLERADDAIACFRKALDLDPKIAEAHFLLGVAAHHKDNFEDAVACYRKALELDPKNAEGHDMLGIALAHQGNLEDAVASYHKALELDATDANTHWLLGNALADQGKLEDAVASYRDAAELDPKLAAARYGLGEALAGQRKLDEAIWSYERAIQLDPKDANFQYALGMVFSDRGKWDEAITWYRKSLELNPKLANAHYHLGKALAALGKWDEAIQALRRAAELDPKDVWLQKAVARFESMAAVQSHLPAFLKREYEPRDTLERLALAQLCDLRRLFRHAAQSYADTFATDPKLADDLDAFHRHSAARASALAGAGEDTAWLDDTEQIRLRKQALDWLRADLAAHEKLLSTGNVENRKVVRQTLREWQQDGALASLREPSAVAKLLRDEQAACKKLWSNVEVILQKAQGQPK